MPTELVQDSSPDEPESVYDDNGGSKKSGYICTRPKIATKWMLQFKANDQAS